MIARAQAPNTQAADSTARNNIAISERLTGMAEDQYESGQAMIDRFEPMYETMQSNLRDNARISGGRANDEWARYQNTFAPVQDQFARDSMDFDSESNIDQATGRAAGTVQGQFDAATDQNQRRMAAMRVSPSSGRSVQGGINQGNQLALSKSGAVNETRTNMRATGIQLRGQAGQMGNQVSQSANRQSLLSSQQLGQSASLVGQQLGARSAALGPSLNMYGAAMGGNSAGGAMLANSANARAATQNANANSTNQAAGAIAGAMIMSDENTKENRKPVDGGTAMEAMRKIPVDEWNYKDGQGDGGHHVGPMAQDVQAAAGDDVAPDGKQIDMISMMGMQVAATKDLDARLRKFEGDMSQTKGRKPISRERMKRAHMEAITL